ncbi:MAG: hypothetical protein U1E61_20770 [Bradyrhizobium sp.]
MENDLMEGGLDSKVGAGSIRKTDAWIMRPACLMGLLLGEIFAARQ